MIRYCCDRCGREFLDYCPEKACPYPLTYVLGRKVCHDCEAELDFMLRQAEEKWLERGDLTRHGGGVV